jgi:Rps23 Pro-64 3,4-dihydroxylase Tpa1-like proline 4-hydroxylase
MTEPAPVLAVEEFLAPQELSALRDFALARAPAFVASNVIGDNHEGVEDAGYRRSHVLYDVEGFHWLIGARILHFLPRALMRLGEPGFAVRGMEVQLTASNDGEFFRAHTDSGDGPVATRALTFVYFCHREPRGFSGGRLRLYARDPATGANRPDSFQAIEPRANMIVFFPSDRLHEITPVACPSRDFADSRFTLNGWLHR